MSYRVILAFTLVFLNLGISALSASDQIDFIGLDRDSVLALRIRGLIAGSCEKENPGTIEKEIKRRFSVRYVALTRDNESLVCMVNPRPYFNIGLISGGVSIGYVNGRSGYSAAAAAGNDILKFSFSRLAGYYGGVRLYFSSVKRYDTWDGLTDKKTLAGDVFYFPAVKLTVSGGYRYRKFDDDTAFHGARFSMILSEFSKKKLERGGLNAELTGELGFRNESGVEYEMLLLKAEKRNSIFKTINLDLLMSAQYLFRGPRIVLDYHLNGPEPSSMLLIASVLFLL